MKLKIALIALSSLLLTNNAYATAKEAYEIYKHDLSKYKYKRIAHELIDGGFYFSSAR